jgi:UrcA family protein
MNTMLKLNRAFAALCLLTLSLQAAQAGEVLGQDDQAISQVVRFADLDLATAAGQKTLQARLQTAVKQVCREAVPAMPGTFIQNGTCRRELLQQALASVRGANARANGQFAARREQDTVSLLADRRSP